MTDGLGGDLYFALRAFRRSPRFGVLLIAILAAGSAAGAAMFSFVNALLFRPLPGIVEPRGLLELTGRPYDLSYAEVAALRSQATSLAGLAATKRWEMDLRIADETHRVRGAMVGSDYFRVLGIALAHGRPFLTDEEAGPPGGHPVAVIGYDTWRDRLGSDPRAVGAVVRINGHPFTIIGVAPEGFRGTSLFEAEEIWVPLDMYPLVAPGLIAGVGASGSRWLSAVARLGSGVSASVAREQIHIVAARAARMSPKAGNQRVVIASLGGGERALLGRLAALLVAIAGAVPLIACASVAGLLLTRGESRRREMAIRDALGCGRGRLVRASLAESLLLAAPGAAAALPLTLWATRGLELWLRANVPDFPPWVRLTPAATALAAVLAGALATGLLCGVVPAVQLTKPDLVSDLARGGSAAAPSVARTRRLLVAVQLALSIVLIVGTGLLAKTLRLMSASASAFQSDRLLQITLEPAAEGYAPASANGLYDRLVERIAALPGVTAVALARNQLPWDDSFFDETVVVTGQGGSDSVRAVRYDVVTPGYFATMRYPLKRGRAISSGDLAGALRVAVVNETLARRCWPGRDPVGKRFLLPPHDEREVVGVAFDRPGPDGPRPFIYLPLAQDPPWPDSPMILNIRTAGKPMDLLPVLRRAVAAADLRLPLIRPGTLADAMRRAAVGPRLAVLVAELSGALALAMAGLGLWGLISWALFERQREFGIRRALGARGRDLLWRAIREGAVTCASGLAGGLILALSVEPPALRAVFGAAVATPDACVLFAEIGILVLVVLLACVSPVRRVLRTDPATALRDV